MNTARHLFWKHGFRRVTIEEICAESGVSKMTFYRYFSNKIELAKAVYDMVADEGLRGFRQIMREPDTTSYQKMEQLLLMKMNGTNEISKEFLTDFYSNPELGLSTYIEEKSNLIWREFIKDFQKAQKKAWFRKDFKPEGLFLIMRKLSELVQDETLLRLYKTPQELVMEMARLFTYGIMPPYAYQKPSPDNA